MPHSAVRVARAMTSHLLAVAVVCGLAGCGWEPPGALLAADAASVVVFGRSITDLGVSAITGRDCSVVRLDQQETYCAPAERAVPDAYCTRTLAAVDCWASPAAAPAPVQGVADAPPPTPAQLRYRAARWPKSITAAP